MDNHFIKFMFLGIVIGVVLFSRMAYPAVSPSTGIAAGGESSGLIAQAGSVPLFILPSVSAEAAADVTEPSSTQTLQNGTTMPATHGVALLVADLATGKIFESANVTRRWPTASLTKLMTATVAMDKIDPQTKIAITEEMFAQDPEELTLVVGGTYTADDLIRLMLLPSSNVAAEALATFYGRGRFIDEMNARARAWGMSNTYFGDPSGISATNQSTATDLLTLAQRIESAYPQIFSISRTPQAYITEQNSRKRTLIKSINDFAGDADFVGGKTGYTTEADGNLISVFRYGGRLTAIIVLGTSDRFLDTQKLYDWWKTQ